MKAFLLAAGFGTRLRPLTDATPKCLVPIAGKPLLAWWLQLLQKHHVTEVLINTHYLHEQVHDYVQSYNRSNINLYVHEFYEAALLGSGGTVRANKDFVTNEDSFLICYADNLTNIDLSSLCSFHNKNDGLLTMALFRANNPSQCGIAALDKGNKIVEFEEKPKSPKGNLANGGIYVVRPDIYDVFPEYDFVDFGKDVLPLLTGRMYGWKTKDYLADIGTMENYEKAQKDWLSICSDN